MSNSSTHVWAVFLSLVVTLFALMVTLGCLESAPGLKHVYFLKIGEGKEDFVNIGVSGYCNNKECKTPRIPFYFDMVDDDKKKELLEQGGRAIWGTYVATTVMWGMSFLIGLFSGRSIFQFVSLMSVLGAVGMLLASSIATGIYKNYSKNLRGRGFSTTTGVVPMGLTWTGCFVAIVTAWLWFRMARSTVPKAV